MKRGRSAEFSRDAVESDSEGSDSSIASNIVGSTDCAQAAGVGSVAARAAAAALVRDFLVHFLPERASPGAAAALVAGCTDAVALEMLFANLEGEAAAKAAMLSAQAQETETGRDSGRMSPSPMGWLTARSCTRSLTSAHFDARAALYGRGAEAPARPYPAARPLDSVAKCSILLPAGVAAASGAPAARLGLLHGARAAERDRAWRAGEVVGSVLGELGAVAATSGAPTATAARWAADRSVVRVLARLPHGSRARALVAITGRLAAVDAAGNALLVGARRAQAPDASTKTVKSIAGCSNGSVGAPTDCGSSDDDAASDSSVISALVEESGGGVGSGSAAERPRQLLIASDAIISIALLPLRERG